MTKRDNAIESMTLELNAQHNTSLTVSQVDNWIGSDTPVNEVIDLCYEVINEMECAVTPDNIMELWDGE